MAYEWTEGGWWPRRHEPPAILELALDDFAASARGDLGEAAAFSARLFLEQHYQYNHLEELWRSNLHQQSPPPTLHEDNFGMHEACWSPLDEDNVGLHEGGWCTPLEDDMVHDDSTLDATGNEGTGLRPPGMGGSALQTELPSDGTSCRDV